MRDIDHFMAGGASTGTAATRFKDVMNPSTGEVQARVPMGDAALLERAVDAALRVQPEWAATNPQKRARVMFALQGAGRSQPR